LDGKIKINNIPKSEIVEQIESVNLDKVDETYDYLLRMPIYSLTKENFEKIKNDFVGKKQEVEELKSTDPKELYFRDLNELKKNLK
jgi:DNA topoisomerase-2